MLSSLLLALVALLGLGMICQKAARVRADGKIRHLIASRACLDREIKSLQEYEYQFDAKTLKPAAIGLRLRKRLYTSALNSLETKRLAVANKFGPDASNIEVAEVLEPYHETEMLLTELIRLLEGVVSKATPQTSARYHKYITGKLSPSFA